MIRLFRSSEATCLLAAISRSDFAVALQTLKHVLGASRWVSLALQGPQEELQQVVKHVNLLKEKFQNWRNGSGSGIFDRVYEDSVEMIGELRIDELPGSRRAPRTGTTDVRDYYRQKVYIPFLDFILAELERRFSAHNAMAMKISVLLPRSFRANQLQYSDVKSVAEFYKQILSCPLESLESQFETWVQQWKDIPLENLPLTITATIDECNKNFLPGVYSLLQIFATIPVSSAEAERLFSALKLLKIYLRSTMSEERLSSLALDYIHSDLVIDVDDIINRFASKNRRLKFN